MAKVNGQPGFTQLTSTNVIGAVRNWGDQVGKQILFAASTVTQGPTALGTPYNINFGPAAGTVDDPVMVNASGLITINKFGSYRMRALLAWRRSSNATTAINYIRLLIDGVAFGNPILVQATTNATIIPLEFNLILSLPVGTQLQLQMIRDPGADNDGQLFSRTSQNGWGTNSSASLIVNQLTRDEP